MNKRKAFAVLPLALALTVLAGCDSEGTDEKSASKAAPVVTRSYVGTAQGTAAFVAVVVDGSRSLAYVCDGVPAEPAGAPPTLQAWFNGPSDGRA
ncbi:MAG TPA: hypothetical protein VHF91_02125, partial [Acidimicrobiales bacterium]|nr:hypothetical protein [Acidimicrobiales bacterium]